MPPRNRSGQEQSSTVQWLTMKNIFGVTHTESVHHVEEKVGGWYDTGLTENGRKQAQSVANRLRECITTGTPAITSSDLLRAKETADTIADVFGCQYVLNPDLREISYGIAEGKPET
jgi:probable phosphoglycerate mutase